MRHGSSCGCPDCMNFHPGRFRALGDALKHAKEIDPKLRAVVAKNLGPEVEAKIYADAVRMLSPKMTRTPGTWTERTQTIIHNQGNPEEVIELGIAETDETIGYIHKPADFSLVVTAPQLRGELQELCFASDTAIRYLRQALQGLTNETGAGYLLGFIRALERRVESSRAVLGKAGINQ